MPNNEPQKSEENVIRLNKRKSPEDFYWAGYRDGLRAALHGIQKSLDHFDDMMISRAREDNGSN
jgi:hypothetical protein